MCRKNIDQHQCSSIISKQPRWHEIKLWGWTLSESDRWEDLWTSDRKRDYFKTFSFSLLLHALQKCFILQKNSQKVLFNGFNLLLHHHWFSLKYVSVQQLSGLLWREQGTLIYGPFTPLNSYENGRRTFWFNQKFLSLQLSAGINPSVPTTQNLWMFSGLRSTNLKKFLNPNQQESFPDHTVNNLWAHCFIFQVKTVCVPKIRHTINYVISMNS